MNTQRRPSVVIGVLFMVVGMIVIPIMDGTAKYLAARYPVMEVIGTRYFFHLERHPIT